VCYTCLLLQEGRTALHLSAGQGHVSVIRDLLRKGADPVRRDTVGDEGLPPHTRRIYQQRCITFPMRTGSGCHSSSWCQ
jgi:ankyrin repeat protein